MTGPVLVLAGTAEAGELATRLHDAGVPVVASFAGRTSAPAALPCAVRVGGFGGVDGLVAELRSGGYAVVVDATHPFAATMSHLAVDRVRWLWVGAELDELRESLGLYRFDLFAVGGHGGGVGWWLSSLVTWYLVAWGQRRRDSQVHQNTRDLTPAFITCRSSSRRSAG